MVLQRHKAKKTYTKKKKITRKRLLMRDWLVPLRNQGCPKAAVFGLASQEACNANQVPQGYQSSSESKLERVENMTKGGRWVHSLKNPWQICLFIPSVFYLDP